MSKEAHGSLPISQKWKYVNTRVFWQGLPASHGKAEEPEHRPIYGIRDVLRWSRLHHLTFRCHLSRVKSLVNTRLELFGRGTPLSSWPASPAVAPICRPITPTFFNDHSLHLFSFFLLINHSNLFSSFLLANRSNMGDLHRMLVGFFSIVHFPPICPQIACLRACMV